ncbi:CDP-glycerol glycerophosphotransferase family protein [Methanobrevibacter filiformis]|uniref:Putative CDP-glycerol:glycerophosphate glycerophosphotransferase n=1 Tax=Methanobrevibacter filiformis TaxID=55758 RepID=A0A162FC41_9EURY|nr:CDP-glycerol glycerophosphotransferase family protein [Methanobrevibacter filiformis]KZX10825.1 putative CDP-glycerol:glycerophosphate glycerophosphotransferase [Methanobrevibacter filiformis]
MKRIGYYLFNIVYYIFYLLKTKNKILAIMTHDETDEGNIAYTFNYFKSKDPKIAIKTLVKEDYEFKLNKSLPKKLLNFFIKIPYNAATSKIILMDNIFLPFAYTKFKKGVKVVQLWHSSGSIKKFALDSEEGLIKKLAEKSSSKNTHLIIGSNEMVHIFKSAFGMEEENIFSIGSSRTDLLLNNKFRNNAKKEFYNSYPELKNKKIILYAPTFRDETYVNSIKPSQNNESMDLSGNKQLNIDIFNLLNYLNEDWVLLLKLHPHISKNFSLDDLNIDNSYNKRIYNVSNYKSLNTLMLVSNSLITDYSSIVFEYSLLNKKMVFYPYDLKDFELYSRGFYFDYIDFIPGKSFINTKEIAEEIENTNISHKIEEFRNKYMKNSNGQVGEKLYQLLIED